MKTFTNSVILLLSANADAQEFGRRASKLLHDHHSGPFRNAKGAKALVDGSGVEAGSQEQRIGSKATKPAISMDFGLAGESGLAKGSKATKPSVLSMDFGFGESQELPKGSKATKPSAMSMDFGVIGESQEFGRSAKAAKPSLMSMDFGFSGEASSEQEMSMEYVAYREDEKRPYVLDPCVAFGIGCGGEESDAASALSVEYTVVRAKSSKTGAEVEMGQGSSTDSNLSMEYVPIASKSFKNGPSSAKNPKIEAVDETSYSTTDASADYSSSAFKSGKAAKTKPYGTTTSIKITPRSIGISEQTEKQVSEANESEASGAVTRLAAFAISIMAVGAVMTIVV